MSENQEDLRKRYHQLNWQWHDHWDSDPDQAIAILQEIVQIAQTLEEPYWYMESRHWLAQALIFKKRDYGTALPLAVQSAIEARQPKYKQWHMRTCLYQDLIAAHVGNDALTHENTVEKALNNMQAEVDSHSQCARCLQGERTTFEKNRGQLDAAETAAQTYLSMATSTHHRASAHNDLCHIMFRREKWQRLAEHAAAAQKAAEAPFSENEDVIVESLLWQAVAHQRTNEPEIARGFFQRSQAQAKLLGLTPDEFYFHGLVSYHEFAGDLESAIAARQAHLAAINGLGALREEAEAYIDLVRLQKRQATLEDTAVAQAKAALAQLKVPGDLPARLETVLTDS